ncbi:MAG: SURF1 family protein [Roseovarius sp.]|jgi:surfeit locus 1 family protein|nr:SURF1 family protein [Roseovarius sp.]
MRKRVLLLLIFGLAGLALLVGLGVWQVQRLAWKEGILAEIAAKVSAAPVALPEAVTEADRYLPVRAKGRIEPQALRVLVSQKQAGAGYRLVSVLETGGRRVLLDRGFIPVAREVPLPPEGDVVVTGNLHWPDDRTGATPANDVAGNIWFARDIAQMAEVLGTEPLLIVARELSPPERGVEPLPVDGARIPNDHLEYAVTWFSFALIWAVIVAVLIRRQIGAAKGVRT